MVMSILPDGPWSVLEGRYDDRPMFVRLNTGARTVSKSAELTHRLGIAVPFQSSSEEGLPTSSESTVLVSIEETLCESLRAGTEVVLTLVITTSGMREFVFYCAMPAHVSSAVASVRQRFPSYEIQVVEESDPDWTVFDQFAGE